MLTVTKAQVHLRLYCYCTLTRIQFNFITICGCVKNITKPYTFSAREMKKSYRWQMHNNNNFFAQNFVCFFFLFWKSLILQFFLSAPIHPYRILNNFLNTSHRSRFIFIHHSFDLLLLLLFGAFSSISSFFLISFAIFAAGMFADDAAVAHNPIWSNISFNTNIVNLLLQFLWRTYAKLFNDVFALLAVFLLCSSFPSSLAAGRPFFHLRYLKSKTNDNIMPKLKFLLCVVWYADSVRIGAGSVITPPRWFISTEW